MDVIAKFRCNGYDVAKGWGRFPRVRTVHFVPVAPKWNAQENKYEDTENGKFWEASPSGKLELGMVNEDTVKQFDIDEEYYIIITKEKPEGF